MEPPSNAGGSQLADHRPETTSFERSSVEDPSIASSIEDASSSESELWITSSAVEALS